MKLKPNFLSCQTVAVHAVVDCFKRRGVNTEVAEDFSATAPDGKTSEENGAVWN